MPHTLVARRQTPPHKPHALVRRQTPSKKSHTAAARRQNPHRKTHPNAPPPKPFQPHPLVLQRYELRSRIGNGFMGTVYRAYDRTDQTDVAIKVVLKRNLHDDLERISLKREVILLQRFRHKHIMSFHRAFEDEHAVYIVTEYCEKGDLFNYLNKRDGPIPEREALKYMRQLLNAMAYLNKHGISHRDIKPENILLSSDGTVKLADFGLCFCRPPKGSPFTLRHCGTPQYASPEVINRSLYVPERSDMWSCGVLLYAMLTQKLPFENRDIRKLQRDIICANAHEIVASRDLNHVTRGTKRLLAALFQFDLNDRPLPTQALRLVDDALLGPRIYKSKHMPW